MKLQVLTFAAVAALGLAACQPAADTSEATTPDAASDMGADATATQGSTAAVAADSEGLRVVDVGTGSTSLVAFGAPRAQVVAAINAAMGSEGVANSAPDCPSGGEYQGPVDYVTYDPRLSLLFRDGAFAGWSAQAPTISTMNGIAPGSTRAAVEEAGGELSESSLGLEGTVGGVGVILDEAGAVVRETYAGLECFAR